ncbi:MAG: stage III sporulation protein AD [Clostridiaceae bacterium]
MEIIKVVSFAFVSLFVLMLFKGKRDDIRIQISIIASVLILLFILPKLGSLLKLLQDIAFKADIDFVYLTVVFKILGISYITTFCSEICKDAEEKSLASKVEFAGEILILFLSIPILMAVLNSILKIIEV